MFKTYHYYHDFKNVFDNVLKNTSKIFEIISISFFFYVPQHYIFFWWINFECLNINIYSLLI